VAQSAKTGVLSAVHTNNGGASWQEFPLPAGELAANAWVGFLDDQNGWVSVQWTSSNAFNRGTLFITSDGGFNWAAYDLPEAGPVTFSSPDHAWLVAGIRQSVLYETLDAGKTWSQVADRFRANPDENLFFGAPEWTLSQNGAAIEGILPVTSAGPGQPRMDLYTTHDGGLKWELSSSTPLDTAITPGAPLPTAAETAASWVAASPEGQVLIPALAQMPGSPALQFAPPNQPEGVVQLAAGQGVYWARTSNGVCTGTKGQPDFSCKLETRIYRSTDGGLSWTDISPR
jgi:hypothetical protein